MVSAAFSAGDCLKKEASFTVKGMHCKSCANLIKNGLTELKGVKKAEVSLAEETSTVVFDSDKVSLKTIKEEVKKLGYSAVKPALPNGNPGSSASNPSSKKVSLLKGLTYGLVPHIGCIGFIAASVLGATIAVEFFKPLLMNPWFFHILVILSIGFATLSSVFYLKKNGLLSIPGLKRKKKYLGTMYGSTVGINLVLFLAVFPMLANLDTGSFAHNPTGAVSLGSQNPKPLADSLIRLNVSIPCPGHAPLISGELKKIEGVTGVKYKFPNRFDVAFNSDQASKQEILGLEVFQVYPAELASESLNESPTLPDTETETASFEELQEAEPLPQTSPASYACSGSCSGSCGGGCSVCSSR